MNTNTLFPSRIPGWLSEREIKEITGFGTTKLWALRQKGFLVSASIGKKIFYKLQSLYDLLEANTQK